ncbi:putative uncharacterized protein [Clostridium sp. CAG:354]|nr:hypothetical protein [Clostridium sp.]MEE0268240.1 hypothetical protein [Clostridia bacterium]CDE10415.1 putative uncharacterized protein [Clostridium sp. CAG:354]
MDSIIMGLNIMLIVLVVIIIGLIVAYYFLVYKSKVNTEERDKAKEIKTANKEFNGIPRETTDKILDFDEIKDDMLIRKNGQQYIMVIQCKGINYDLLSEEEKESVERGFVEFLNTIRFPIQLYVQTRSLNLRKTIDAYKEKVNVIADEIKSLQKQRAEYLRTGNQKQVQMTDFEIRRKENVLEYGQDISNYIGRMSFNQNVLQQKTYVVVSYFKSELGNIANYSKDEIINMVFTELYTRAETLIRSLGSAQVSGRILDSEELTELLYIAYNRDEEQIYQLDRALDAQYDALYSTSKDVLQKQRDRIDKQIDDMAVDLASDSLLEADNILKDREKLNNELRERTIEIIEEYKNQLSPDLYNETKKIIEEKTEQEEKEKENKKEESKTEKTEDKTNPTEAKKKATRGRPKKADK